MKAVLFHEFGGLDVLQVEEVGAPILICTVLAPSCYASALHHPPRCHCYICVLVSFSV